MRFERSVEVEADPAQVWAAYAEVERWPEWTASVTSVDWLGGGSLEVGSRARIRQPRLPVAVWTVTEVVPGRSFTWTSTAPGLRTTGVHLVERAGVGARATARIDQEGPLGTVVGLLTRRLTGRYLELETTGLRARCEP